MTLPLFESEPQPPCLKEWAPQDWPVAPDWQPLLADFWASEAARQLGMFMHQRLELGAVIYPSQPLRALALTPLERVRVLILGQDPYHGPGQAEGLAFSVATGMKLPPSLRNIFKEIQADLGCPMPQQGSLQRWAEQGVLLLNSCLTVEQSQPGGHAGRGWECLSQAVVQALQRAEQPLVLMLWGAHAQALAGARTGLGRAGGPRLLLEANHPSPLSALRPPRPFIGCRHFSQANAFLQAQGCPPIVW